MKSHGNQSLVMGDGMPWNGGGHTVWSSLGPAYHGHMCMKTSNWLEGEGAWGVERPPEPLALQVLEQTNNVKTKSSEMEQPRIGPGSGPRKRRQIC